MTVPSKPSDVKGIPEKYSAWRTHQAEIFSWLQANVLHTRLLQVEAPTGIGKSVTLVALAKHMGLKALYVVGTKQLQKQLEKDFPDAVVMWGRDNFKCLQVPNRTAETCVHNAKTSPCPHHDVCPYRLKKAEARSADLAVVNYAYFLTECNYVGDFSGWPLVILDEADVVERQLLGFVSLQITDAQLKACDISAPKKKDTLEDWRAWAVIAKKAASMRCTVLEYDAALAEEDPKYQREILEELKRFQHLCSKLKLFIDHVDEDWVYDVKEYKGFHTYQWRPIRVSDFGQQYVMQHGQRFVAMSATMPGNDQWTKNLGLNPAPILQVDSPFPVDHRLIKGCHVADFSKKNVDADPECLVRAVAKIDEILDMYPDVKGLIHTQSYALNKYVMENSTRKSRLITHTSADEREEALQKLFDAEGPLVLCSPSMTRGVDLPGEKAEFQIIIKIPFPDFSDEQVRRRKEQDQDWYTDETARTFVQMTGRIVRGETDSKITWVLDSRLWGFTSDAFQRGFIRKWWMRAVNPGHKIILPHS